MSRDRELAIVVVVGLLLLGASLLLGLNGDVEANVGGQRVAIAPDGTAAGLDAFTHRPLVYRAVIAGLTGFLGLLQLTPSGLVPFEMGMRLVAVTLSLMAAMLLFLALRPRLGAVGGGAVAMAVGTGLALAPSWDFLQAEWLGSLLTVLAVAAALLPRSTFAGGAWGGLLLVLTAAAKLTTASYAVIGLLAIVALDRRRGVPVVIGGAAWGIALLGLLLLVPHEARWMRDTLALSGGQPLHTLTDWGLLASAFASEAAASPALIIAPAALVVLLRLAHPRDRWWLAAAALLVLVLAAAPLVVQVEGYLYRLTVLPILGGALVAVAAFQLWLVGGRSPWWIIGALALASGVASILVSLPTGLRAEQIGLLEALVGTLAVVLAAGAWFLPRPGASLGLPVRHAALLVAVAVVALSLPAVLPSAAWSLDPARTTATNLGWFTASLESRDRLSLLSARIGPQSEVLYLAEGDVAYHMGNPVRCRYPSPIFLKVGARRSSVRHTGSYADNLACVTETSADWLILEPGWLGLEELPEEARRAVDARFDCTSALTDGDGILACPAR